MSRRIIDLDCLETLVLEMSYKHSDPEEREEALKLLFSVLRSVAQAPEQLPLPFRPPERNPGRIDLSKGPSSPYLVDPSPFTTWCKN